MFPLKTGYGNALSSTTYLVLVQRQIGKKGVARETSVGSKLGEVLKCGMTYDIYNGYLYVLAVQIKLLV